MRMAATNQLDQICCKSLCTRKSVNYYFELKFKFESNMKISFFALKAEVRPVTQANEHYMFYHVSN